MAGSDDKKVIKKRGGRPSSWTLEIQEKIEILVKNGNYIETACAAVGIHKDTLYEWLKRGARGEAPFKGFSDSLQKAVALAESLDLARIQQAAASGVWTASAWRLERRHPERWARKDYLAVQEFATKATNKLEKEDRDRISAELAGFLPNIHIEDEIE